MSVIGSIFGRGATLVPQMAPETPFRLDRPEQLQAIKAALDSRQSVIVFGLPRQGKTTLVREALVDEAFVMTHADKEMSFEDIFRSFLMSTGCSVLVEKKRRRQVTTKAEVQLPWTVKGSGEAQLAGEYTLRTFTADISNHNDVAFLLREIPNIPILVIDRFELLSKPARQALLSALVLFSELRVLRVVLISSDDEHPLQYHEKVRLDRHLAYVHIPPLSLAEVSKLVQQLGSGGEESGTLEISDYIHRTFAGSVDLSISAAELAARGDFAKGGSEIDDLSHAIQERMRNQLLQFLAAIFEKRWYVPFVNRSQEEASKREIDGWSTSVPTGGGALHDLAQVLEGMRTNDPPRGRGGATSEVAKVSDALEVLQTSTVRFGNALLSSRYRSGSLGFLAFAVTRFLKEPDEAPQRIEYLPASYEQPNRYIHIGSIVCQMLIDANLDKRLSFRFSDVSRYGLKRDLLIAGAFGQSDFNKMIKRLRRLQSRARILPEPFVFADDGRAYLWLPHNRVAYGDVRPSIKALLFEHEQTELDNEDEAD
jgi:hypothetical protein